MDVDMNDREHSLVLQEQWLNSGGQKKIYLAGRYDHRERFLEYVEQLEAMRFKVQARWLAGDDANLILAGYPPFEEPFLDNNGIRSVNHRGAAVLGRVCAEDVRDCDILIFFAEPLHVPARKAGRMVELGMAIGWNLMAAQVDAPAWPMKRIIVIGHMENAFMCMNDYMIERVISFEEAKALLGTMYALGA